MECADLWHCQGRYLWTARQKDVEPSGEQTESRREKSEEEGGGWMQIDRKEKEEERERKKEEDLTNEV